MKIGVSLVLYHEPESRVLDFIQKITEELGSFKLLISVVFNSPHDYRLPSSINQILPGKNLGYGSGHNLNYEELVDQGCKKILIANTDVSFNTRIRDLFILDEPTVVGPQVMNNNGSVQRVVRTLPTFASKVKSFLGFDSMSLILRDNELQLVPSISGCFFVVNVDLYTKLKYSWLFDPSYFVYEEDTDLCRRLWSIKGVYVASWVKVTHQYAKGSSKNFKLFLIHLKSIVNYFSKWGFLDEQAKISKQFFNEKKL